MEIKTYRQLLAALQELTNEQLDCDITVEDVYAEEFYPGEFMIADSLEPDHPVIRF